MIEQPLIGVDVVSNSIELEQRLKRLAELNAERARQNLEPVRPGDFSVSKSEAPRRNPGW